MSRLTWVVAVGVIAVAFASSVCAQSVKDVVGTTPSETVGDEPPPKLFIDPPLAEPLSRGAIDLQYRVQNFHILPVVGAAAVNVSPRVGHLHVGVDDLPWYWVEASDNNTIIVVGLPPGPHKISLDLADPQHHIITGKVVAVTIPNTPAHKH